MTPPDSSFFFFREYSFLPERMRHILAVVPAAIGRVRISVDHLPKDFDRRLRTVDLLGWHVQVVHEDKAALAERRPEDTLSALVQLPVNDVLRLLRRGLCAEGKGDVVEFLATNTRGTNPMPTVYSLWCQ